jgi:hypothetical protein
MSTHHPRPRTQPHTAARTTGARLARLAAALTAITCGLLASTGSISAAFARVIPPPGGPYGTTGMAPGPGTAAVVTVGGMPGWQITLIALGAALVAAAATLLLARALAAHRSASATSI